MDPKVKQAQNPVQNTDQQSTQPPQPQNPVSIGNPEVGPIQEVERPVSDYSSYPAPPANMPSPVKPTPTVTISDDIASTPSLKAVSGMSLEDAIKRKDGPVDQTGTWEANEVIKEDKKSKEGGLND